MVADFYFEQSMTDTCRLPELAGIKSLLFELLLPLSAQLAQRYTAGEPKYNERSAGFPLFFPVVCNCFSSFFQKFI
jgi:hypothetical protein